MRMIVGVGIVVVGGYLVLLGLMLLGPRWLPARRWPAVRRLIIGTSLLYPMGLLGLMVTQWLWPQDDGLWAVLQILAPYLFLPLLLLLPLALFRHTTWLRWMLVLCGLVFLVRFGSLPQHVSPPPADAPTVSVLNWNVGIGTEAAQIARVRPVLLDAPADLVVLAEAYWAWLAQDPAVQQVYPYQTALYWNASKGLVILSRYPILAHDVPPQQQETRTHPRQIVAQLDVHGVPLTLVAVHTPAGTVRTRGCVVICYEVTERNQQLDALQRTLTPLFQQGTALLVVGDFNLTTREPRYAQLADRLQDTHVLVGQGGGHTWPLAAAAPGGLQQLLPLLRIDYQWSGKSPIPQTSRVDCTYRGSDHCMLWGTYALSAPTTDGHLPLSGR
ncbi:MAG TPA: endonuclease/exonuclease/phosphatase family protein [Herpetosiphonaceae bacterium]